MSSPPSAGHGRLQVWPAWQQWAILIAVSVLSATVLELGHFPAALLVGPMLAAVIAGVNGATIRPPGFVFSGAQAIIGCLVAGSISPSFFPALARDWPVVVAVALVTLAASGFLGWLISRWRILPGTTGVWGTAPGAASAMVLTAGAFGADQRLVAFMQYLRVIMVTAASALIARFWVGADGSPPLPDFLGPVDWPAFAATMAVAVAGATLARLLRLPTPYFLGPMLAAVPLEFAGLLDVELPPLLLAVSYAAVGWTIGLRFTRETIRQVRQSIVQVSLSIIVLMLVCGGLAWGLHVWSGIDPLTAYLATSPGGMDAIAIIATAAPGVDLSFVMVMQMFRFILVLLFGPALARMLARRLRE